MIIASAVHQTVHSRLWSLNSSYLVGTYDTEKLLWQEFTKYWSFDVTIELGSYFFHYT